MNLKKTVKKLPLLGVVFTLAACSNGVNPLEKIAYTVDVPQGNYIEQERLDMLKVGMTVEQVVYLLGSPVLKDSFGGNRFSYIFLKRKGTQTVEQKIILVYFDPQTRLVSHIEDRSELDEQK